MLAVEVVAVECRQVAVPFCSNLALPLPLPRVWPCQPNALVFTTAPLHPPLPPTSSGLSGLSPGTLHLVLTGEGEAALVLSEAAHQILRQQNVDGYAPSGACRATAGWQCSPGGSVLMRRQIQQW